MTGPTQTPTAASLSRIGTGNGYVATAIPVQAAATTATALSTTARTAVATAAGAGPFVRQCVMGCTITSEQQQKPKKTKKDFFFIVYFFTRIFIFGKGLTGTKSIASAKHFITINTKAAPTTEDIIRPLM